MPNLPLLDYLLEAMKYDHGLSLECEDPIALRKKLYVEQRKWPDLAVLSFFLSPTNPGGELWIVKGKKNGKDK